MINLIKKTWIPITIIGTFITAFVVSGIMPDSVIQIKTTKIGSYEWKYYTFNIHQYLINIEQAIKGSLFNNSNDLTIPTTPTLPDWTNITAILKYIVNILIYVVNWLIVIVNVVLLFPLKILLYPANILITLLGLNTANSGYIQAMRILYDYWFRSIIYL